MITPDGLEPEYVEELEISVKITDPEKHRPIFQYGRSYTIIQRERFKVLVPCEACKHPEKTYLRVVIRDDETGQKSHIGLHCMTENFGITEAQLDSTVLPITFLVENWHGFIIKARPELHRLDSRDAELTAMLELLPANLGFACPAVEGALSLVRRLVEYKAYVSSYKDDIEALRDFIGLQHDLIYFRELFTDRGVNLVFHPKLSKEDKENSQRVLQRA